MVNDVRPARTWRTKAIAAVFAVASAVALAAPTPASAAAYPAAMTLHYNQFKQSGGWDCGPYATKIMLSTMNTAPTINEIIAQEGTRNPEGTDSIQDVGRAINYFMAAKGNLTRFHSVFPKGDAGLLRLYILSNINSYHGFVVNVVDYQTDVNGISRGYGSAGHYVAVVGYNTTSGKVNALISDPGNGQHYYMNFEHLTAWIGGARGISVTPAS
jgi:hypothetical protein